MNVKLKALSDALDTVGVPYEMDIDTVWVDAGTDRVAVVTAYKDSYLFGFGVYDNSNNFWDIDDNGQTTEDVDNAVWYLQASLGGYSE